MARVNEPNISLKVVSPAPYRCVLLKEDNPIMLEIRAYEMNKCNIAQNFYPVRLPGMILKGYVH